MPKKKTIPKLKKDLTIWFNRYIRLRDCENGQAPCISCGKIYPFEKLHAGHFIPSTYSPTRFDELNVHAQCGFNCNTMKHGNLIEYRPKLIQKIGIQAVEELERKRNEVWKWDRAWLEEKIEYYKKLVKEIEG